VQDKDGTPFDFPTSGKGLQLEITVKDPETFAYKLNNVAYGTVRYGAVDNGGVSGGTMDIITKDKTPIPVTSAVAGEGAATGYTGYEILYSPTGGQYGNSAHYVEIIFPAGSLKNYSKFTCHYTSDNCDLTGKSVRLKAMTKKPGRTYNPGPYIATTSFDSSIANGKEVDISFDLFKDNAVDADGQTRNGIYGKGKGADLSNAATDADNAGRFIDDDGINVKDATKIYIWILPWGDVGTKFTISDINFVP